MGKNKKFAQIYQSLSDVARPSSNGLPATSLQLGGLLLSAFKMQLTCLAEVSVAF